MEEDGAPGGVGVDGEEGKDGIPAEGDGSDGVPEGEGRDGDGSDGEEVEGDGEDGDGSDGEDVEGDGEDGDGNDGEEGDGSDGDGKEGEGNDGRPGMPPALGGGGSGGEIGLSQPASRTIAQGQIIAAARLRFRFRGDDSSIASPLVGAARRFAGEVADVGLRPIVVGKGVFHSHVAGRLRRLAVEGRPIARALDRPAYFEVHHVFGLGA